MTLTRTTLPLRHLQVLRPSIISRSTIRFASGDYGSGSGDPKGENPQKQGANPSADKEHPGPPPPKVGQNTGGATKGTSGGHNASQSTDTKPTHGNDPTQGKRTFSTSTRRAFRTSKIDLQAEEKSGRELRSDKTKDAEPKILSDSPPKQSEQTGEVKKHNEDMEKRAEQAHEKASDEQVENDKVSKGFWSGHGGADRQP